MSIKESKYHFFYLKWVGVQYDREKCIEFFKQYKKDKANSKLYKKLIKSIGESHLKRLLEGDFETCRRAVIEMLGREAARDLLLTNQYSKEIFVKMSNLPLEDYKLVLKRAKELYDTFMDIKIEEETTQSKIPGM